MQYTDVCSLLIDRMGDETWPVWLVVLGLGLIAMWEGVELVWRRIK